MRCFAAFPVQSSLDEHLRQDVACEKRVESLLPEGFNAAQKELLKSRPRGSEEDKWRGMYRILFSDDRDEDMPSPCELPTWLEIMNDGTLKAGRREQHE